MADRRPTLTQKLGIAPLVTLASLAFYRWALREIHPTHPDVPLIVMRINALESMR